MNRVLVASLGLAMAASLGVAHAADFPVQQRMPTKAPPYMSPLYNWTGFYLGLNGGGAWGTSRWNSPAATTGDFNMSGGMVGATAGYNYQVGQIVWGLEGDIDWARISGSTTTACGPFSCRTRNDWLGTVRGRVGYAFNQIMPYVTGGLAVGNINASMPGSGLGDNDTTKAGWTVGAGFEFAIAGNLTAKAEYLYVDLGDASCTTVCGGLPANVKFTADVLRAGLNYRF